MYVAGITHGWAWPCGGWWSRCYPLLGCSPPCSGGSDEKDDDEDDKDDDEDDDDTFDE